MLNEASMLRVASWTLPALLILSNCGRTEEPQSLPANAPSSGPAKDEPPTARVSQTRAAPRAPGCVVPMPPEPPAPSKAVQQCPTEPASQPDMPRGPLTFVDAPGQPRIEVERALDDAGRARGLMYRTALPDDGGMLFSWNDERVRSFWMRNTCIPLDMLFISADAVVVGVLEQVPPMNDQARSVPCPARHVLEVNAGYVRAHGIKPGQRVELPAG